jgi:hypothetical protein
VVSKTETRQDEIGRRRDAIEGQLAVIAQMLSGGTLGDGDQTS